MFGIHKIYWEPQTSGQGLASLLLCEVFLWTFPHRHSITPSNPPRGCVMSGDVGVVCPVSGGTK